MLEDTVRAQILNDIKSDIVIESLALEDSSILSEIDKNASKLNENCFNYLTLVELLTKHNLISTAKYEAIRDGLELSPLIDSVLTKDKVERFKAGDISGWYFENSVKTSDDVDLYNTKYGNQFNRELKKCYRAIVGVVQISPSC